MLRAGSLRNVRKPFPSKFGVSREGESVTYPAAGRGKTNFFRDAKTDQLGEAGGEPCCCGGLS